MSSPTYQPAAPPLKQGRGKLAQFAAFAVGLLWLGVAELVAPRAAQGIANRLNLPVAEPLLRQVFLLFLLMVGFGLLGRLFSGTDRLDSNALPLRPTARQEWLRGVALGWAILLCAVLPITLFGLLHPHLWLAGRNWGLAILSVAALLLWTLALEVAFRGFLFARLIALLGPVAATTLLSFLYALTCSGLPNATLLTMATTFVSGVLLSTGYLRTHALWLSWGLHFAWIAVTAVALGLPIQGYSNYSSLVTTSVSGPAWFSGGPYGPEAAVTGLLAFVAAIPLLYRITRDYAWQYTHAEIVPMGYPVTIAPPAAHTAMESIAAAPPALVQIHGSTPAGASTLPVIDSHLRALADSESSK